MSFGKRAAQTATDPWLALISVFGGGVAWAVGLSAAAPVAVAAGMYAAGVAIGGLIGRSDKPGEAQLPRLAKGTNQAKMVSVLEHYVTELGRLRGGPLPDEIVDAAIEARVSAESAQLAALRVAGAVDGLDSALSRVGPVSGSKEVRASVQRMTDRRKALLGRLQGIVDEVAEVYTKLLETSATLSSLDVGHDARSEVEQVNASLDSLRQSLAELDRQPEL